MPTNGREAGAQLKPGESFNPWRGACGFYAPDVVGRVRDLPDRDKRLYETLVRIAGKDGRCYPSVATLAARLGWHESKVKRTTANLEKYPLIRHQWRSGRRSNTYQFLWHQIFDSLPVGRQREIEPGFDSLPVGRQIEAEGHEPEPQEPIGESLTAHLVKFDGLPVGHEFSTRIQSRIQSSSSEPSARPVESSTTTRETVFTDEQRRRIEHGREKLRAHRYGEFSRATDSPDAALVLELFEIAGDVFDVMVDSCPRPRRIQSWGFYLADARDHWPNRRAATLEAWEKAKAQEAARRAAEASWAPAERCGNPAEKSPQSSEPEQAPRPRARPRCVECSNSGLRHVSRVFAFCVCAAGDELQRDQPAAAEDMNAGTEGLRAAVARGPRARRAEAVAG